MISKVPGPNFTRLSPCHTSLNPDAVLGSVHHYGTCALGLTLMLWVWIQFLLCCCPGVGGTLRSGNMCYCISFQLHLPAVSECFYCTLSHLPVYCQYNLSYQPPGLHWAECCQLVDRGKDSSPLLSTGDAHPECCVLFWYKRDMELLEQE